MFGGAFRNSIVASRTNSHTCGVETTGFAGSSGSRVLPVLSENSTALTEQNLHRPAITPIIGRDAMSHNARNATSHLVAQWLSGGCTENGVWEGAKSSRKERN